jgi:RimJ/RimL family protein N-acetyltransferase
MTPRVALRPLTLADAEVAARWGDDDAFSAYAGWTVGRPAAERAALWRALVSDPPYDLLRLAAYDAGAGEDADLVGYVDLHGREPGRRELGYLVGSRAHWGRGWGGAIAVAGLDHAFGVLGLDETWAEAVDANAPSVRILQRLGMTETGRGDDVDFLGEPSFYRQFAITRAVWSRQVAGR